MRMLKPTPAETVRHAQSPRAPLRLAPPAGDQEQPAPGVPVRGTLPKAATAPVEHGQNWFKLLAEAMGRQAATGAATMALLPFLRADTGAELLDLQYAVVERIHQMQQDWWQGWAAWVEELSESRRADTMSEHVEQQYNLMQQFVALFKAPASDLLDLQDTVEVNYGYWAAQKLARQQG